MFLLALKMPDLSHRGTAGGGFVSFALKQAFDLVGTRIALMSDMKCFRLNSRVFTVSD